MTIYVQLPYRHYLRQRNDLMDDVIRHIEDTVDGEDEQLKLIEPILDSIAQYWPCSDPIKRKNS